MLHAVVETLRSALDTGVKGSVLGAGGMAVRTVIIYGFTLVLVRMGSRRFLTKAKGFDTIMVSGLVLVVTELEVSVIGTFRTSWLGSIIARRT